MTEPRFAEAALRFLDQQPISARNAVPSRHIRAYRGRMGKLVIHEVRANQCHFVSLELCWRRACFPAVSAALRTLLHVSRRATLAAEHFRVSTHGAFVLDRLRSWTHL